MKKILFGLSAILMLFATSCQDEPEVNGAGETSVSFKVETPEIKMRSYSDGATATELQYAVYDAEGKQLKAVTDAEIHGSTTVKLQLTTGNTYSVIFWAAAPNAPYEVDLDAKTMTVDYANAVSNDESRDAFYAYYTFTVKGPQAETIKLKRPFAQLNIGTGDMAESTAAGYTPTQSAVTVKNIYNTLNLVDGTVSGDAAVTYATAAIPADETFPVAGYDYLAMNYLLVAADKEVVDVEFTYTDGSNAKTRTVGSVPVQRNYRTNIYGDLLTSNVDVNVDIVPDYDGEHNNAIAVATAAEFQAAINTALASAEGAEVVMTENITIDQPIVITGATAKTAAMTRSGSFEGIVIDGNGKTLTYAGSGESARAIDVKADANGVNVLIKNLTIDCTSSYCQRGINYNTTGKFVLDNVTVSGKNVTYALNLPGSSDGAEVVIENSSLTANIALNVWGENVEVIATNTKLTSVDNATHENYSAISLNNDGITMAEGAVVTVIGGTVTAKDENGNPSYAFRNATETGIVQVSEETTVVGVCAKPVAIVNYGGDQFYSCVTLQRAISKAIESKAVSVRLIKDVEVDTVVVVAAEGNLKLELNGHTITAALKQEGRHHYAIDNYGTLVLDGKGAINARGVQNFGTMTIDGDITITNVDTNGGSAIWNEGKLTINKGTFTTNDKAGTGSYGSALNTQKSGEAIVNGGTFIANSQLTYAILNSGKTTINSATVKAKHGAVGGTGEGVTVINDGSFELMENPGVSDHCAYKVDEIKGGQFTLGKNTDSGAQLFYESKIAAGYKTVVENGWTKVVKE